VCYSDFNDLDPDRRSLGSEGEVADRKSSKGKKTPSERHPDLEETPGKGTETSGVLGHYSQWHLAKSPMELSETELAMAFLRVYESFSRWVINATAAINTADLSYQEILLLHAVRMQSRPRGALQIAQTLNRTDLHNVQYSLRKLEKAGLISRSRDRGNKTHLYSVTEEGFRHTEAYAELRRRLLIPQLELIGGAKELLAAATRVLTLMTGIYEEQAFAALTYEPAPNASPRGE
jgi:predicted MarR family transcription regulator